MGAGEQGSFPQDDWGIGRVLLYQCLVMTEESLRICREPRFVLLDEISGGCLFPAVLGTLSAMLGRWQGVLCPSSCGCEEAWRTSSLLSLCQRKPRTPPHPTRASQPLVFLKHFDHSHGHCIFILMLRFFFFLKKNLSDLNGCGEVKQAECPPILGVEWGGNISFPLPLLPLPSPHRSSKALASSNKHFCEKAYLHEDPGDSPRSQQRRQSEGYIGDRETDMGIRG